MSETPEQLLKSCLAMAIVIGVFLIMLLIAAAVVFSTQLGSQ